MHGSFYKTSMPIEPPLVFSPFRLDAEDALLWRDDEQINLPPKTFEVLRYLVDHSSQLVTKADLLDAVSPNVAISDSMRAISAGVSYLLNQD